MKYLPQTDFHIEMKCGFKYAALLTRPSLKDLCDRASCKHHKRNSTYISNEKLTISKLSVPLLFSIAQELKWKQISRQCLEAFWKKQSVFYAPFHHCKLNLISSLHTWNKRQSKYWWHNCYPVILIDYFPEVFWTN